MADKTTEVSTEKAQNDAPRNADGLRTDGPTEAEYRAAGYAGDYPPHGYAPNVPVKVKAIRTFQGVEGWKNPTSEPFEVSSLRAADLKEAGLVEFVTDEPPAA